MVIAINNNPEIQQIVKNRIKSFLSLLLILIKKYRYAGIKNRFARYMPKENP
jgi:hypothetical protein